MEQGQGTEAAERKPLTEVQGKMLRRLRKKQFTVEDAAAALGITRVTAGQHVRKLVAEGYLKVVEGGGRGKVQVLERTEAAIAALAKPAKSSA